jgi:very-short-patch-repair endonuclease
MTDAQRRLAAIATGQLGTFSRAQALDAGLSNRQLRRRVQSGILDQIGPNAFRFAGAPPTPRSQLQELLLDVGTPVWVAGPSAVAVLRFEGSKLVRPFHLVVPSDRNVRRNGAVIHRFEDLAPVDLTVVDGFPVTSVARTIIDMALWAAPFELRRLVEEAVSNEWVDEEHLFRRIGALRSQGRWGIPALLGVLDQRELTRGGESWLEREYLRLVASARLPRPETQVVLAKAGDRVVRVDCHFPGTDVVVELLGYRFHRTRTQMNRDAERHNALLAAGKRVYQFTYDQVTMRPADVTSQTASALGR